jgi:hypothetical protein
MDIIWKGGRLNWTFHNYEPTLHFLASFPHMSSLFQYCPWSTNLNQLSFNLTLRGCNHLKKNLRTKKKNKQWVHSEMWECERCKSLQ